PTALSSPHGVEKVAVTSAAELLDACLTRFPEADITVMSAAVADFTPKEVTHQKIKKGSEQQLAIDLVKTTDVLATLGRQKKDGQILVGFALETDDGRASAEDKLRRK